MDAIIRRTKTISNDGKIAEKDNFNFYLRKCTSKQKFYDERFME
jgi:hypothetical protein